MESRNSGTVKAGNPGFPTQSVPASLMPSTLAFEMHISDCFMLHSGWLQSANFSFLSLLQFLVPFVDFSKEVNQPRPTGTDSSVTAGKHTHLTFGAQADHSLNEEQIWQVHWKQLHSGL